jgi:hypothetical protein
MAISVVQDVTVQFNNNGFINLDCSGWETMVVQLESPTGTVYFNETNDSGGVEGVTDGGPAQSTGYQPVQGINLANGATLDSVAASGLYRFQYIGRYLQITANGGDVTASKVLVQFSKIN